MTSNEGRFMWPNKSMSHRGGPRGKAFGGKVSNIFHEGNRPKLVNGISPFDLGDKGNNSVFHSRILILPRQKP